MTSSSSSVVSDDAEVETRLAVFRCHWQQALSIIDANGASSDDVDAVSHYAHQMVLLLAEEAPPVDGVLSLTLAEDILSRLTSWPTVGDRRLLAQRLSLFELLLSRSRRPLLLHAAIVRPLLRLLTVAAGLKDVEAQLVTLLYQLGTACAQHSQNLELLFNESSDAGDQTFLVFSLLVPFTHREGDSGQTARDTLLLLMSLSAKHDKIGRFIAHVSDFCPVLATGLSGLYSSLPQKLDALPDDWHCFSDADVNDLPDLVHFLNSLEFCNAVVQVAHQSVAEQLLSYIYNGFLVPVLGPALHQNEVVLAGTAADGDDDDDDDDSVWYDDDVERSSVDEVIAVTAYLDLFLRRITEPSLMRIFLRFVLTARHDDVLILDSLVSRIASTSRLCMVSLSLFSTLLDLNCEDIMYQLVFRYLVPCNHIMVSQRQAVRHVDMYSKTADKLLALTPVCPALAQSAPGGSTASDAVCSPSTNSNTSLRTPPASKNATKRSYFRRKQTPSVVAPPSGRLSSLTSAPPVDSSVNAGNYRLYLNAARARIQSYTDGCKSWSAPYDGQIPPPHPAPTTTTDESDALRPESSSDTDSAISRESLASPTTSDVVGGDVVAARCADSPLNDNFGNDDFDAFLLSLRQVQTPVQLSDDDMETSLREMDALIRSKLPDHAMDDADVVLTKFHDAKPDRDDVACPVVLNSNNNAVSVSTENAAVEKSPPTTTCNGPTANDSCTFVGEGSAFRAVTDESAPSSLDASPVKCGPDIGPFLTVLLHTVESLMHNSLYVNLLLTGVLARLACYPQPLLRSFLLDHSIVFQPCVKSTSQILSSVKHKIISFALTHKDFDSLVVKAREFLAWRESRTSSAVPSQHSPQTAVPAGAQKESKRSSLGNFLFRRGSHHSSSSGGVPVQLLQDGIEARYVHRPPSSPSPHEEMTSAKTRNCVYAALVLDEFLLELAAVSQEHAVVGAVAPPGGAVVDMPVMH